MEGLRERLASRAGYALTVLVGAAAGGGCALAVSRPWVRGSANVPGLPPIAASVDGADVAPATAALAIVCLAGFGAVLATRGAVRRGLGVVIAGCGVVVAALAAAPGSSTGLIEDALAAKGWAGGSYDRSDTAWRVLAVVSAVIVVAAGAAVARFGGAWATMGTRYDAPTEARRREPPEGGNLSEAEMWRALDEGDDPTRRPQ